MEVVAFPRHMDEGLQVIWIKMLTFPVCFVGTLTSLYWKGALKC